MGPEAGDDKEIVILGRVVHVTEDGYEYEADPRHKKVIMDFFGFEGNTRSLAYNGDKDDKEEDWELEDLDREGAKSYRGIAARMNFMSLDCPNLQFAIKGCQRDMGSPKLGSWKLLKKVARYILGMGRVVWKFGWQGDFGSSFVGTDSDWGGDRRDRKSTSGVTLCSEVIA